jgi:phytoene dehydrogenase-like protein
MIRGAKMKKSVDTVVVGGGLTGLISAIFLRQRGKSVILLEKSKELGGRAISQERNGFKMNLGPHALYIGGAGFKILCELQIPFSGKAPSKSGNHILHKGRILSLPSGPVSLLTTRYFSSVAARLEAARVLALIPN